jgi:hypothetical protein
MTRPITTVKKEIRILGLDTCDPNQIIGVVVRGGLFLDGVLVFKPPPKNNRNWLANQIVKIPYYPELRGIMLHDPSNRLNPSSIERLTQLFSITLSHPRAQLSKKFISFKGPGGRLLVKTRLPTSTLEKIFTVTWTTGKFPEPVRVAHLLAKTRFPKSLIR